MHNAKRGFVGLGAAVVVAAGLISTGAAVAQSPAAGSPAAAGACTVGVSWNNFQQPRWAARDKPAIQSTVEAAGGTYIDADANLSTQQQITDVNTLIQKGANVIILLAQDNTAVGPALKAAADAGVPVIAYDRLIEDPAILYVTFDNVGVGKAEADAIIAKVPKGNYVLIKGDPGDPNASTFLPAGWDLAGLKDKVASGDIKIIADQSTPAWKTDAAQNNMEAIIDKANADGVKIDAVLAENDSTALGVVAALTAKNYGVVPVSGQDGDTANLNNVAKGLQYVDVWKNASNLGKVAGAAALQLCANPDMSLVTTPADLDPAAVPAAGPNAVDFTTPNGTVVKSLILTPQPITADNLQLVLDAGWITKDDLCKGVDAATAPAACK
jgi:D-xylose transport system substrate-binding protein